MAIGWRNKEGESGQVAHGDQGHLHSAGLPATTSLGRLARAASVILREINRDGFVRTARRAIRAVHLYGISGALSRGETAGGEWILFRLRLRDAKHHALPQGIELRRGTTADIPLFAKLEPVNSRDARRRMEAGGILWLALADKHPVFACWTFTRRSPVGQANGGWLRLPPGVAHLKDIVTAENHRGLGIAPGAISAIAAMLVADEVEWFIGRPEAGNVPSRRVYEKLGFSRIPDDDPVALDFATQLSG
jgi:RimJ/RimL family protein N-acetyltransferase